MARTFPEALVSSEAKSLGRFLYEVHGGPPGNAPILLGRKADQERPYWRVFVASINLERAASGWDDGARSYVLGYFGNSFDDVTEKIDRTRANLRAAVPCYVFDAKWFTPSVALVPGPGLPAGTYTISASFYSQNGEESLPCNPATVTLPVEAALRVRIPSYPEGSPLAGLARVYLGAGSSPRRLAGSAPYLAQGYPEVTVSAVPGGAQPTEPSSSVVFLGPLTVEQYSIGVYEDPEVDGDWDGILTLQCSRPLSLSQSVPGSDATYTVDDVIVAPEVHGVDVIITTPNF